jgi:Domain of unknown function (DUF4177)
MKWEYKSITYKAGSAFGNTSTAAEVEELMNQLGKDGWELAAALAPPTSGAANVLIFKRPKAIQGQH